MYIHTHNLSGTSSAIGSGGALACGLAAHTWEFTKGGLVKAGLAMIIL